MRKIGFVFAFTITLLLITLIQCYAAEITYLIQDNIEYIQGWINEDEFVYISEKEYIFNVKIQSSYESLQQISEEQEWYGNKFLKIRYDYEKETFELHNMLYNDYKTFVLPNKDIYLEEFFVSENGAWVALCIFGESLDWYKWILLDTSGSEVIELPLEDDEFSFPNIVWSNDGRFCAIEYHAQRGEGFLVGILIYDLMNKSIMGKTEQFSGDYYIVHDFNSREVLYSDDKRRLSIYNVYQDENRILLDFPLSQEKISNSLIDENGRVYFILNGGLAMTE